MSIRRSGVGPIRPRARAGWTFREESPRMDILLAILNEETGICLANPGKE